jgi:hypothetical protein
MTLDNHTADLSNRSNTLYSPLATRQMPREHPRLFGSRARLQALAQERPDAYRRTREIADRALSQAHPSDLTADFGAQVSVHAKLFSMGLIAAIEEEARIGRATVDLTFEHFINQPVQVGHVPFGDDVGNCAIVYDLCHEHWTAEERRRFHAYLFECRDRNADEELSVFHDGWWHYKNAGFVLGLLAVMHEADREMYMLYNIDREFRVIAADALRLAGDGGGYAEGFYVNYYMYSWLVSCEAMRHCTGADWLAEAPEFYRQRAIASAFEQYPGIRERGSRRPLCVGDGRGRVFKVERDRALAANRILVSRFREDPAHQAINTFLKKTPHVGADENAYKELLWFDPAVKQGDLSQFRLSHVSRGPGYVYARSSWEEDATWFFFKCGKRYTAHQHLDVGHFFIVRHEELASEGGHYAGFGDAHDINYYLRTIAHNSVLVHDPDEVFACIRGFTGPTGNDGGQAYPWPGTYFRHNGEAADPDAWRRHPELGDIADLVAFHDAGAYVYTAGDCTRAYSSKKLEWFTRQIVFIRPGTFIIFDRVKSRDPQFRKTWLLHAAKPPTGTSPNLVITNGKGRLHVQTVLPLSAEVKLNQGEDLYRYGGGHYPPRSKYGPEAECRIEVSPAAPALEDCFLHVLTATDATVEQVPQATTELGRGEVVLKLGAVRTAFSTDEIGGWIEMEGRKNRLANEVQAEGEP